MTHKEDPCAPRADSAATTAPSPAAGPFSPPPDRPRPGAPQHPDRRALVGVGEPDGAGAGEDGGGRGAGARAVGGTLGVRRVRSGAGLGDRGRWGLAAAGGVGGAGVVGDVGPAGAPA